MKRYFFYLVLILATSCGKSGITIVDNGVTVKFKNGEKEQAVKATVLTDQIIKIESSATNQFDSTKSLIEVGDFPNVSFTTDESENEVSIKTNSLIVKINKINGVVSFYDVEGNPIINEAENGRTFSSITVDSTDGYSLIQQFNTPKDEALYGLGQHQADEMNYKGKNEELFQYNTKVSIPVIISTKNYGILWDNYSLSRFGDPRPYKNIDQFKLYDADGKEGGFTATYVNKNNEDEVFANQVEKTIDYENLETIQNFPEGVDFNNAKITWEGDIESDEDGTYRFLCYYAGYTKLWVDGDLQFYKWRTAWNPSVAKFNVEMNKGERKHIKLEWYPDGGVSYIGLKALSPRNIEDQQDITFSSEMGKNIRYYFMYGNSMDDVVSQYRAVTGKAQVMPKWSMGFWQSRERYKTADELLDVLQEFRDRHIPIDNIVLDWSHWRVKDWGSHEFDLDRFPDPKGMIDKVHDLNAHFMISVWPKFYHTTEHYKEFNDNGWMYKKAVEDSIRDWIYPGYIGSFYDAYNADARKLFWKQIKEHYYTLGIDAWWLDATEPDILSNASIELRKALMNPTAFGPSTEYFNAYALMNAKGIYEGQRSLKNNERVFILTRSGFAGLQNYGAVTWSGDIGTRWEDMKAQISAGINFAMSGLPYWTMDVGGFCVEKRYEKAKEGSEDLDEWRELNTRWYQFGAFAPLFRAHGQYPFREVYNLAPESHPAYKSMLKYNKLRYRLMPYIYSLTGWTHIKDYTIMRGLAMDFSSDEQVYNIGDQFMFGPSLLVAPVYEYKARERKIYLPESDGWYSANTGEFFEGGQEINGDAPYESMPLFVKAGSVIPVGPEIEYTSEKPDAPITIYVYSGANGSFDLYEDEGINYNYEDGKYSIIPMKWNDSEKTLTISAREGDFEGMVENRVFRVVVISDTNKVTLFDPVENVKEIEYDGSEVTVSW